jgi:hypothetical protein
MKGASDRNDSRRATRFTDAGRRSPLLRACFCRNEVEVEAREKEEVVVTDACACDGVCDGVSVPWSW